MPEEHDNTKTDAGGGSHEHLLEENRRLAQRYLDLESKSRHEVEKLRSANALLARGEAHMRDLLENAAIGFALLDINLRIVSANPMLCGLLGYREAELTGENFNNFVYVGKLPAFARLVGHAANRPKNGATIELVARDGRLVPCRMAASDWLDESGALRGCFVLAFNVDEEIRAATRLRAVEESMAEVQKARQFFLDVVSRELRTPAGGVMGMARMLMDSELTERQAELAGVIHSSATSLVRLVDDIVDVLRIDTGDMRPEPAPLRPRELAQGVADMFAVLAEEKGLELRVDVSDTVPDRVVGDASRLRRVLIHLLDNAFKFTDKGRVTLVVDVVGESLRFMVSDTGHGIIDPGRDLFADSLEGDTPLTRRHGGVGIGLPACRRLVAVMGGRIDYESVPGQGSEFHFTIPLTVAGEDADGDEEAMEPPPEAMRLPHLDILLADGNPMSRQVAKAYLQFDGHTLAIVDNGLDAAERCRSSSFDLALLDLHLPKFDGLQALRLIREDERTSGKRRTPVLFLAPPGQMRDPEEYIRAGADGVVRKPVKPVELMAAAAAAAGVKPLSVARQKAPGLYAAEASGGTIRRLDGAQLVNLRQIMPLDQFTGIFRFFMEDAVPGLMELQTAAHREEPDPQRIAFAASKVRGMAGYLGFSAMADLLKRIESAGRTGAPIEELRALVDELPMVTDDSLEELKRILPDAFATISEMSGPIVESE